MLCQLSWHLKRQMIWHLDELRWRLNLNVGKWLWTSLGFLNLIRRLWSLLLSWFWSLLLRKLWFVGQTSELTCSETDCFIRRFVYIRYTCFDRKVYLLELELTAVAGGNLAGSKTLKVAICHSDRACSPFLLALDRVVDVLQFSYVPFEITPPPLG